MTLTLDFGGMLIKPTVQKTIKATIVLCVLWSTCINAQTQAIKGIEHVVVIGFDGLSPDGLQTAKTPTFDRLVSEGASTMHARAVLPTSSSSNWASMIMGAGPEQHGITSNAWDRDNFTLPAVTQSEDFLFPTIFKLIKDQLNHAEVGAIYHWGGFGRLFEKSAVDYDINPESEEKTAQVASEYIKTQQPKFTFIHFDHVDHAGHSFGHGTLHYYKSVEKADVLLNEVLQAIETSEMAKNTLVIVSSDHGGLGTGHGGESLQEVEIPFIVWGPSVKKGYTIQHPVYQYDNAATVAYAMGIETPRAWIGKPIQSAFEGFEETDSYPVLVQLKEPIIYPKAEGYKKAGGLFTDKAEVKIENPNQGGEIRFTTDGSFPTASSQIYEGPFILSNNSIIKSAVYENGKIRSLVAEAYFRIKKEATEKPVKYELFYLKDLTFIPELKNKKPDLTGHLFEITSDELGDKIKPNTTVRFTSEFQVTEIDSYRFYIRSDDGSKLLIDGKLVVDNDGDHGVKEKSGQILLKAGTHQIEVLWFNGGGDGWLDVFIENGKMSKQILSTKQLQKTME